MAENLKTDPLGKIMMAVILACVLWVGNTTYQNSIALAQQVVRIEQLQSKVNRFSVDRYTGTQAASDMALIEQRLASLEQLAQNLSDRLRAVENSAR